MPTLYPDVVWVWRAFNDLARRRSYSFSGPHPISYESMHAYAGLHGIEDEDKLEFFVRMIPQLDDLWLEDFSKRQKAEADKKKNSR